MADEQTEQKIAAILKNQNDLLSKQVELESTLRDKRNENLTRLGEERAQVEQRLAFEKERLKNLAELSKLSKQQRDARAESLEVQKQDLEVDLRKAEEGSKEALRLREKLDSLEKSLELNKEVLNLSKEELETLIKQTQEKEKQEKLNLTAVESNEQLLESTKELLGDLTGISDQWKTSNTWSAKLLKSMSDNLDAGKSLGESFKAMGDGLKETFTAQNIGASMILGVVSATKELLIEQDNQIAAFKKATGLNGEYTQSLVDTQQELKHLGVQTGDMVKAFDQLSEANSTFVFANKATRDSLSKTTATFEAAHNAGAEAAATMGVFQTTLGMTAEASEQAALDLGAAAKAMKKEPNEILAEFAALGPQLAAWGPNTKKVFLETAAAAKALNMQTSEMLSIAEGFDTFDDAADRVGQLNAALGGDYFDTVEMVMATEEDRIEMIMDGIDATGRAFADMGKFERKRIAEAAGMTVEQLSKIANGNRDLYNELQQLQKDSTMTYNDLSEAAQENMGIEEKLAAIKQSLAISMRPLVELTLMFLGAIQSLMALGDGWVGWIVTITGLVIFFGAKLGLIGPAAGAAAAGITAAGSAATAAAPGIAAFGASLATVALGLLGFGATVLLIGGGIAIAAYGMSLLVESFATLGDLGWETVAIFAGLASTLYIVSGGITAIAGSVGLLGTVSFAASAPILAVSSGILAIGAGVGLATIAFGFLIDRITGLVDSTTTAVSTMSQLSDIDFIDVADGFEDIASSVHQLATAINIMDIDKLKELSGMDLALTSNIEATRVVKDTIVAASKVGPTASENIKQVSDQIIRLVTETASAGNTAQLQIIKEIIKESAPAGQTSPAAGGKSEIILKVDGATLGKILMPHVDRRLEKTFSVPVYNTK